MDSRRFAQWSRDRVWARFHRLIPKRSASAVTCLVLFTPVLLIRLKRRGVSDKDLSERLAHDLLDPVVHEAIYGKFRNVSPLLASRNVLETAEDPMAVATKRLPISSPLKTT